MTIQQVTFDDISRLLAVALVLVGAYAAIMSAVKTHREERTKRSAPMVELKARLDAHDKLLARDKERLDSLQDQSIITLRGVRAILSHEVNGNSVDKMKQSMAEIDDYLIRRK